jgi:hypothetical protein
MITLASHSCISRSIRFVVSFRSAAGGHVLGARNALGTRQQTTWDVGQVAWRVKFVGLRMTGAVFFDSFGPSL